MKIMKINFHYLITTLILLFISSIIIWSLYQNIILTPEHVVLILVIALIGLSFSFDKLSIGKIFSVEKKMKKVEEKQEELTEENHRLTIENSRFKQEMLTFMVNSMNQISNQLSNQTVTINTGANVVPASEGEVNDGPMDHPKNESPNHPLEDNEAIPTMKQESSKTVTGNTVSTTEENTVRKALKQTVKKLGLSLHEINYNVRIDFPDKYSMEKRKTYDAFLNIGEAHYFFKVMYSPFNMANVDRVQNMLNDLNLYMKRNDVRAKLVLILIDQDNDENQKMEGYLEKFERRYMSYFQPAIERGCLIIDGFEVDGDNF
ncbi:hypothetical protein [Ornithinibacillus sp. 179-J 7C1 HS]|uniref:hypothetical protein n=1 Tax=Ornithinibacillus sp. 179-J 7C1 HS TaxID=3142384 RepID=UPI0039A2E9A8